METRRCPYCHKLQRSTTQQCSRCGRVFERKQDHDLHQGLSQPSLPIASPHRAGHYFGVHPEDQPYQSNKIVTPHLAAEDDDEDDEPTQREFQEPAHIVLPSTDSAPALKVYRESLVPPHATPTQVQQPRPIIARAHVWPTEDEPSWSLSLPTQQPRRLIGFPLSRRLFSILLIVSCLIFLLATAIIALSHLTTNRPTTDARLLTPSGSVHINDIFLLKGEKWAPRVLITFTDDNNDPLPGADGRSLKVQTSAEGTFQVRARASADWQPGSHTLYATDEQKQTASASIQVQALPTPENATGLTLSAQSLDFGEAAPGVVSEQNVTLNCLTSKVSWQASSDQPWLSLTPTSGSCDKQQHIALSANRAALDPDQYTGSVEFVSQGTNAVTLTLTVTLGVTRAPAMLSLSATTLIYSVAAQQAPAYQNLTIRNAGGESMQWSSRVTTDDGASWLTLTPASGSLLPDSQSVLSVQVDPSNLSVGTYSGLLLFEGDASARVRISLSVIAPGNLVFSPPSLAFSVQAGQAGNPQPLTLQNSGQLTLNWSVSLTTSDKSPWLTVTPDHGSVAGGESVNVQVNADATALAPGAYQGTLTFTAGAQTKEITLSFTVIPPPTVTPIPTSQPTAYPIIQIKPILTKIDTVVGQPPATLDVTITNAGQAPLNWTTSMDAATAAYITLSPKQGTLAPGQSTKMTITVDVAHAHVGEQVATITISDASGQSQVTSRQFELDVQVKDLSTPEVA